MQTIIKNNRKMILGMLFLLGCFWIMHEEIIASAGKADFTGLGVAFGGISGGVLSLVWGYNKEHDNETKIQLQGRPS